ncbi:competence protein CoiA [Lentibacillus salinarum]|uniref:Competence protein CoiA n=1 Tax=Lentibacillus salinarum TaxID=446820 RepID=A0ABW3ZPU9_9BACI
MLQAKTEYGKIVTLASLTRREIAFLKKETQFFCPACRERVIARAGPKTVPHFAHNAKSHCPSQEGGEGAYHEKGKLLLYRWLQSQQLDVQLETFLPAIGQRPDILLKLHGKTIAIEYQCARIPPEQIIRRNQGYHSQGIVPIWILGANRFNRRNRNQVRIDQFQLHFMHQFSSDFPLTLYYFCPETLRFILFQDFYFTTAQQATGKLFIKKLTDMIMTDLFQRSWFNQQQLCQIWKQEKRSFRLRSSGHVYGRELAWQQWLYVNRTHRETLPSMVYLPVASQYRMNTPPWDWQSRLCLEVIAPLTNGETFSLQRCMHVLRSHLRNPRLFPLVKSFANPVYQYLYLLERMQVIREVSPKAFAKQTAIPSYQHLEAALNGDNELMNQLIKQNIGMNHL